MTIVVLILGRAVTLGIIQGNELLAQVDATWTVGSGESFVSIVERLLKEQSVSMSDIKAIAVARSKPSHTTIRTVLAWANTIAWAQQTSLFDVSMKDDHMTIESLAQTVTKLDQSTAVAALFPTYQ